MQAIDRTDESIRRIIHEMSFQKSILSLGSALDAARSAQTPSGDPSSRAVVRRSRVVMPPGEAHAEIPQ